METKKNNVRLTGFSGAEPVIVEFANNKRVARISLAVNEFYKDAAGQPVNETQWFDLVFWNKKIALIEDIVKKGTSLSIEVKLSTQIYTDKKGEKRKSIEILIDALKISSEE